MLKQQIQQFMGYKQLDDNKSGGGIRKTANKMIEWKVSTFTRLPTRKWMRAEDIPYRLFAEDRQTDRQTA